MIGGMGMTRREEPKMIIFTPPEYWFPGNICLSTRTIEDAAKNPKDPNCLCLICRGRGK